MMVLTIGLLDEEGWVESFVIPQDNAFLVSWILLPTPIVPYLLKSARDIHGKYIVYITGVYQR
ncbi:hypothetical protein RND71_030640 [Anisodus tanguticus]|uniref:Uncharacterized protein n=1 Tax=Anisodus tanguticus TaxID=243964 RepID=A0AAE1RI32_9SOLA|nr:hypothetical protein RND71_030640 [Anisodus tanguticus]